MEEIPIDGRLWFLDGTVKGYPFIACFTEADDNAPVEVTRDPAGITTAVRLCWTSDVDELEASGLGTWDSVSALTIESGRCLAWDPRHHVSEGGFTVDIAPGQYAAEAFCTNSDCLGLRINKSDA